jgi:hypothetical protein
MLVSDCQGAPGGAPRSCDSKSSQRIAASQGSTAPPAPPEPDAAPPAADELPPLAPAPVVAPVPPLAVALEDVGKAAA